MDYTPGPWKVVSGMVFTEDDRPIARMVRDDSALKAGIMPVERDCNARLIAASPVLYGALRFVRGYINVSTPQGQGALDYINMLLDSLEST